MYTHMVLSLPFSVRVSVFVHLFMYIRVCMRTRARLYVCVRARALLDARSLSQHDCAGSGTYSHVEKGERQEAQEAKEEEVQIRQQVQIYV